MQYRVEVTFTEPLLGTAPLDPAVYSNYILDTLRDDELRSVSPGARLTRTNGVLQPVQEEGAAVEQETKGRTGFHKLDDGAPILYDYVWKGYFKDACSMLNRVEGSRSGKIKAYKKIIDGLVFIFPRQIPLVLAGDLSVLERPLRAQTAQGERVALAASEMAPTGTRASFTIDVLDDKTVPAELLKEWFDYGKYRGLGGWRNASWGRYTYTLAMG